MFVYRFLLVCCFAVIFVSCKEISKTQETVDVTTNELSHDFDYLPTSTTQAIYKHQGYAFSYAEEYEQSEWVAYLLLESDFSNANYERPFFNQDPLVVTKSADWRNYKNSGYNKGHLCPAGDRKKNFELYEETFFTSNASPQLYDFNAGVWNRLEQKVRYWAGRYNGVYVVTGGVLSEGLKTIGKEDVAVPNYFYKVILTKDQSKMIGLLVPHKKSDESLYEFVVPVDTIEKMTGIDFFSALDDTVENRLESNNDTKGWSF